MCGATGRRGKEFIATDLWYVKYYRLLQFMFYYHLIPIWPKLMPNAHTHTPHIIHIEHIEDFKCLHHPLNNVELDFLGLRTFGYQLAIDSTFNIQHSAVEADDFCDATFILNQTNQLIQLINSYAHRHRHRHRWHRGNRISIGSYHDIFSDDKLLYERKKEKNALKNAPNKIIGANFSTNIFYEAFSNFKELRCNWYYFDTSIKSPISKVTWIFKVFDSFVDSGFSSVFSSRFRVGMFFLSECCHPEFVAIWNSNFLFDICGMWWWLMADESNTTAKELRFNILKTSQCILSAI